MRHVIVLHVGKALVTKANEPVNEWSCFNATLECPETSCTSFINPLTLSFGIKIDVLAVYIPKLKYTVVIGP